MTENGGYSNDWFRCDTDSPDAAAGILVSGCLLDDGQTVADSHLTDRTDII